RRPPSPTRRPTPRRGSPARPRGISPAFRPSGAGPASWPWPGSLGSRGRSSGWGLSTTGAARAAPTHSTLAQLARLVDPDRRLGGVRAEGRAEVWGTLSGSPIVTPPVKPPGPLVGHPLDGGVGGEEPVGRVRLPHQEPVEERAVAADVEDVRRPL